MLSGWWHQLHHPCFLLGFHCKEQSLSSSVHQVKLDNGIVSRFGNRVTSHFLLYLQKDFFRHLGRIYALVNNRQ